MYNKYLFISLLSIVLLSNCSNDETLIDPADADALTDVLILPDRASQSNGDAPAPSDSQGAPQVDNLTNSVLTSNGSTAILNYRYSNLTSSLSGCYLQVNGAGSYFTVPYSATAGTSGTLQLPLGIPTNVDQGEFCVTFCIYDEEEQISNFVTTCINVLRLGTGSLQISLSWDNETDQDLYVVDPLGNEISYINSFTDTGGALDRDDTDGFGPENIFWLDTAPDGQYTVRVNDFENDGALTNFFVTVSAPSTSRNFDGTTQNGSTADVVTFRKNGTQISF